MKIARILIGAFIILIFSFHLLTDPLLATLSIVLGLVILPYTWDFLKKKYNFTLDRKYKVLAVVVLTILTGALIPKNNSIPISEPAPEPVETKTEPIEPAPTVTQETVDKAEKQAELDALLNLAIQGKILTDYEFSDTKRVLYADKGWYTQTVVVKKNFMSKIANLRKEITGYHTFQVLDAYSNEKVGEVTAFSGSVEVYK